MSNVANVLKKRVVDAGLTLSSVSKESGVSLPQLSRIASGGQEFVSADFVARIAPALGQHGDELVVAHLQDCAHAAGYRITSANVRKI